MKTLELTDDEAKALEAYIIKADYWEVFGILQKEYGDRALDGMRDLTSIYCKLTGKLNAQHNRREPERG